MRGDRGSAAIELTLLTPLLVLLLLFVVFGGRMARARIIVDGAASDAARAASIARTPASAEADAKEAAAASVADDDLACEAFTVAVDGRDFRPGGAVAVTVRCTVNLSDLAGLTVPGVKTVEHTATAPIDTFRGTVG